MDPRSPLSPVGGTRGTKRRLSSPPETVQQLHTVNPAHTSLPSISQLVNAFGGPTQPVTGASAQTLIPPAEVGYYTSSGLPAASSYLQERDIGSVGYGLRGTGGTSGAGSIGGGGADSEHEEPGITDGPPKKKRRRQALSCTECKRRKIKCDRSHPCTPCTRRGEQHGCVWHIVEPAEKYATKAEFDDLKARFTELEAVVQRLLPASGPSLPHHVSGISTGMAGLSTSSNVAQTNPPGPPPSIYHPHQSPGTNSNDVLGQHQPSPFSSIVGYDNSMPPPPAPMPMTNFDLSGSSRSGTRYIKAETSSGPMSPSRSLVRSPSPRRLPRPSNSSTNTTLPPASATSSTRSRRSANSGEGTTQFQRQGPQSITGLPALSSSPQTFTLDASQQPKNCKAQMLNFLGEHLRTVFPKQGPAVILLSIIPLIRIASPTLHPLLQPLAHHAGPLILPPVPLTTTALPPFSLNTIQL